MYRIKRQYLTAAKNVLEYAELPILPFTSHSEIYEQLFDLNLIDAWVETTIAYVETVVFPDPKIDQIGYNAAVYKALSYYKAYYEQDAPKEGLTKFYGISTNEEGEFVHVSKPMHPSTFLFRISTPFDGLAISMYLYYRDYLKLVKL